MPRTLTLLLLTAILATGPPAGANMIYDLKSYPSQQNAYSLSGYIMTDGTIGTITAANIEAWAYTVRSSNGFIVASGDYGGNMTETRGLSMGSYITTASGSFEIPQAFGSTENILIFSDGNALGWERTATTDDYTEDSLWAAFGDPLLLGGNATWVIGQETPEPGSLLLALIGGGCLAAVGWWRRG